MEREALIIDTLLNLKRYLAKSEFLYSKTDLKRINANIFNSKIIEKLGDNSTVQAKYSDISATEKIISPSSTVIESQNENLKADLNVKSHEVKVCDNILKVSETLDMIRSEVNVCQKCSLSKTRHNTVFGEGSATAKLLLVGEAPGEQEDAKGVPFVGSAGNLLTKMLKAINIEREDVFICNVLKCRPPLNRDPDNFEVKECSGFLERQLRVIKPDVILALGRIAAQRLLNIEGNMSSFRQKIHQYNNTPVVVTYHPSALLRNEKWKRPAWEDLKFLQKYLDRMYE